MQKISTAAPGTQVAPLKRKSRIKRVIAAFFIALFGILAISVCLLLIWSPGKISPITGPDGEPLPGSVSQIVRLNVGGVDQGMIIKGENTQNPVLLFLHGGPGSPEYMLDRRYPTGLEKAFTVCWWDQRGSGMSFHPEIPRESMTLEQLIADTVTVTNYLRERFGKEKIYILGHSWGSFLGMHVIEQYPQLYEAYIGIGQVTDQLRSEQLAYEYMRKTAQETGDTALDKRLAAYTIAGASDLTMDYMGVRAEGMNKQGIGMMRNMKSMFGDMILPLLQAPEYTMGQKIGYARGISFSTDTLWDSVSIESLMEAIPSVEIPVFIVQGKYDYQVSYALAKEYSELLQAPSVRFYTMENSAHSPCFEEPERFMQIMREEVLAQG